MVLISGYDGGTGASPLSGIKHAGIPWELGLAETHQTLVLNNLRSRIIVEADGQLKTGRDVVIAALLGAEEFGFATAPLVAMGCIMMRVCHLNTCPVGVATQDPELRTAVHRRARARRQLHALHRQEVRELMAQLGFRTLEEDDRARRPARSRGKPSIIGRRRAWTSADSLPARSADRSRPLPPDDQDHGLEKSLDNTSPAGHSAQPAIERKEKVLAELPIRNVNRVVGTIVGSEITRRCGPEGLPEDTIELHFTGSAGQSFGAFMPKGMTLDLEGDSNDYLGKGLSGGKIIVFPPKGSTFVPEENIIIGNVALYGATGGEAYIRGMAGERFCVRNSGVNAVVESVGDHGCEYMTGGRVVVLGQTGRNFAAGMSGGVAYVLDEAGDFATRCNLQMVGLEKLEDPDEIEEVWKMIQRHQTYTQSERAARILANWQKLRAEVRQGHAEGLQARAAVARKSAVQESGLSGDQAIMAAFEENAHDGAAH